MNDEGDCRTAPATPGLLITNSFIKKPKHVIYPKFKEYCPPAEAE